MNKRRYFNEVKTDYPTLFIFKAASLFSYRTTAQLSTVLPAVLPALRWALKSGLLIVGVSFLRPFPHCGLHCFTQMEPWPFRCPSGLGSRWGPLGAGPGPLGGCGGTETAGGELQLVQLPGGRPGLGLGPSLRCRRSFSVTCRVCSSFSKPGLQGRHVQDFRNGHRGLPCVLSFSPEPIPHRVLHGCFCSGGQNDPSFIM